MEPKLLPEKKFSTGAISATIWKNNGMDKHGNPMQFVTVQLQRRYKNKSDVWQTSSSLRLNDLPKAMLVLQKAYEYLVLKKSDSDVDNQEELVEDIVY